MLSAPFLRHEIRTTIFLAVAILCAGIVTGISASEDFHFATKLLSASSTEADFEIVERLASKIDPTDALQANLIRAELLWAKAKHAPIKKRMTLLTKSIKLSEYEM